MPRLLLLLTLLLAPPLLTAQDQPPAAARDAIVTCARAVAKRENRAAVRAGTGRRKLYEEGLGFYTGDIDSDGDIDVVGSFFTGQPGSRVAVGHTVVCIREKRRYRVVLHRTNGELSRMLRKGGLEYAGDSSSGLHPRSVGPGRVIFTIYDHRHRDDMNSSWYDGAVEFRYRKGRLRFSRILIPVHRIVHSE